MGNKYCTHWAIPFSPIIQSFRSHIFMQKCDNLPVKPQSWATHHWSSALLKPRERKAQVRVFREVYISTGWGHQGQMHSCSVFLGTLWLLVLIPPPAHFCSSESWAWREFCIYGVESSNTIMEEAELILRHCALDAWAPKYCACPTFHSLIERDRWL